MSTVSIRVDEETKAQATKIAEDFGFDLPSVTRAFYLQMIREQRIPLNLSYPAPNAESQQSIVEAQAIAALEKIRFNSADEMIDDLGI